MHVASQRSVSIIDIAKITCSRPLTNMHDATRPKVWYTKMYKTRRDQEVYIIVQFAVTISRKATLNNGEKPQQSRLILNNAHVNCSFARSEANYSTSLPTNLHRIFGANCLFSCRLSGQLWLSVHPTLLILFLIN